MVVSQNRANQPIKLFRSSANPIHAITKFIFAAVVVFSWGTARAESALPKSVYKEPARSAGGTIQLNVKLRGSGAFPKNVTGGCTVNGHGAAVAHAAASFAAANGMLKVENVPPAPAGTYHCYAYSLSDGRGGGAPVAVALLAGASITLPGTIDLSQPLPLPGQEEQQKDVKPKATSSQAAGSAGASAPAGSYAGPSLNAYSFPNPFTLSPKTVNSAAGTPISTDGTVLHYDLPTASSGHVIIRVFSVSGELVRVLDEGTQTGGATYYATWDGKNANGAQVATGVYFAVFDVAAHEAKEDVVKMAVVK